MTAPALTGTIVLVTGAARGLGRAMSLGLAAAGAHVAALDLPASDQEMAALMAAAREAGVEKRIRPIHCDVTNATDAAAAVAAAAQAFGAVHGLINNAARGMQDFGPVLVGTRKKFFEVEVDSWKASIDTNVNGPFVMARAIAPRLLAQGRGKIVNIVTSHGTIVAQGFSPYGPSKAALEAATVIWAKDLDGTGVTVNALLPGGPANTRMIPQGEVQDRGTLVQPDRMVLPIQWLMSRESDGLTGRRFVAKEWDAKLPWREAAEKVSAPAGW